MKVYLAGTKSISEKMVNKQSEFCMRPFVLESFFYADKSTEKLIPWYGDFLLDSGAFTFMQNSKSQCDFDAYLEKYADFIKRNNVKKFFELDIDSVVGYSKVKQYRNKLERLVGGQCIPVWHKSRGKEEFLRMCDEYPYVAIGGIVSKEIEKRECKYFPWFISEAHKRNAKIHGLGFSIMSKLPQYHFDSVDSTTWITDGSRYGHIHRFDGVKIKKQRPPKGMRVIKTDEATIWNFREWVKFQKYALTHL